MKKIAILLLCAASAAAIVVGCDGGDETTSSSSSSSGSGSSSSSSGEGGGGGSMKPHPAMPAIGKTQIDRFGRPAINTALTAVFEADMAKKGMAKDAYNANADPTKWTTTHAAEFAANLAVLDGLDATCGNQMLADAALSPMRYAKLAGTLADDRQWLNSDSMTCTTYLAVEGNALGNTNTDCGGRGLAYDVIDTSYSLLAIGMPTGVTDGIAAPAVAPGKTFPYLAPPVP